MIVIGLTGGIGSGKSTVLQIMREDYSVHTLLADDIGKKAFEVGTDTYNMMVRSFGEDILTGEKTIDKSKLASIILNDDKKLKIQNEIVHPYVTKEIKSELNKLRGFEIVAENHDFASDNSVDGGHHEASATDMGGHLQDADTQRAEYRRAECCHDAYRDCQAFTPTHLPVIVAVESAILYEAGCDSLCDEVWVVTATDETRISRLADNRGYSKELSQSFMSRQMSEEEYIKKADKVIYNNGSVESLRKQLAILMAKITLK